MRKQVRIRGDSSHRKELAMTSKSLTKSAMVVLGCAGAAVAAPVIAPYLATLSLPYFGAVLAGAITNEKLKEKLVEAIGSTAAGLLTEIGGHFATDKIPRTLSPDHNFHLERMLATAYLNSLKAIEKEIEAGKDKGLKAQAAQIFPFLKRRIKRGLEERDLAALFPLQSADQSTAKAFANRFSAENVTLLIGDEEKWREHLGDEVEIALRRWLNEERAAEERAAQQTQLGLSTIDERVPDKLRLHVRSEMPRKIAHQIGELVKHDDFKESWIAFQRAHLQGIGRVVERIETSQGDIKESVDALAQRIEGLANEDKFVAALAKMQQEYLSQLSSSHEQLAQLLERQSGELRDVVPRLSAKIEQEGEKNREKTGQEADRVIKRSRRGDKQDSDARR